MNVLLVGLGRWGEMHLRVLPEFGATRLDCERERAAIRLH